jgi:hypothetical protein
MNNPQPSTTSGHRVQRARVLDGLDNEYRHII